MSTLMPSDPVASRRRSGPATSAGAALSFLAAGACVAVWHAVEPLPHGWWLASFLVLVGGVAQLLLGAGRGALVGSAPSLPARLPGWDQALLWNAGTVLVPLGVLADARLGVVLGGGLLIVALGGLSLDLLGARHAGADCSPRWQLAYAGLLAFLAASVVVGTALAWDKPWT
jgi:hypothetical protein